MKTHNHVLRTNIGWMIDPVAWAQRQTVTEKLMAQNDRLADALQRAGEDVIRPGSLTLISAVTNIVETQRIFRAVRFLPIVAARDRRPLVNGLKLYIHEHPASRYFRYAVMTCAEPVPAFGDLRGAIQELSRRISKWAHEIGQRYDIEVLYRGVEFTRSTAAERDADAAARGQKSDLSERYGAKTVLYHVHANVLYWPKRNIDKLWPEFLRYTQKFMYAHWRDNGKVEKVEEIVKYCSKPADTLAASDAELVWLYRQTQRLKICQPLGPFKSWMKGLKDERKKIARVHQGRGDGQLMRVRKGKRGGAEDDAADNDGNFIEDAEDTAGEDSDDAPTSETRERLGSAAGSTSNLVIGLTLPQWRHTPWAEPMIMVQDYEATTLHSESEDGAAIRMWQQQAREWWDDNWGPEPSEALRVARMALDAAMSPDDIREAAEAACYIVHTCSSTVREGHDDIPDGDEEVPPEELDEDAADFVALFEGGTVVRLRPHPPVDDDEIPFESPAVEAWREKLRAEIDASAVRLLERRASLAHAPGRSSEHGCRIAA